MKWMETKSWTMKLFQPYGWHELGILLWAYPYHMCALRLSEKRLIDRPSPLGQLDMNPGRFAPITCSPPLNRYYIIKDVVFFDNFLVIIYKFISYNLYAKKIIIHFGLLWSKISSETFLVKFTKNHTRTVKKIFLYQC